MTLFLLNRLLRSIPYFFVAAIVYFRCQPLFAVSVKAGSVANSRLVYLCIGITSNFARRFATFIVVQPCREQQQCRQSMLVSLPASPCLKIGFAATAALQVCSGVGFRVFFWHLSVASHQQRMQHQSGQVSISAAFFASIVRESTVTLEHTLRELSPLHLIPGRLSSLM